MKRKDLNLKKYAIREEYLNKHNVGGQLLICKFRTLKYQNGEVVAVYREIGNSKNEFTEATHRVFDSIDEAFAVMSGKEYVEETPKEVKEKKVSLRELEIAAMKSLVSSTKTFDEETMVSIGKLSKVLAKELFKRNN